MQPKSDHGKGQIIINTLNGNGIPTSYIVDSAVCNMMKDIDLVIVGAEAIMVNGAVVNKIGTLPDCSLCK
ncbi:MAG: hypothetical protein MJ014_03310 [Methanocorpusculum sp.]|nr:hypothetical protein [Methanocorpusculum sp.]